MPKGHDVLMGCGFALVFLFLGIRSFTKTEDKFIFYI
jgi:ABC-type polysaccharide/polyol phosphate export permease